jgi:hydroxymethylglutaryl-CoA reductase
VDVPAIVACYQEWQHLLTGAGKVGFGINVANLIAGVFIATGQDVASIESCHSNFSLSALSATVHW